MNYTHADECGNCPKRNDESGCPWWWEIAEKTNMEIVITRRCGKAWLPLILIELTKALLRPQESMESVRNTLQPLMDVLAGKGDIALLRIGHE